MNDNLDPTSVDWSRNLFASLTDGGAWAVPRSGLIFNRRGDTLVLTARMPHDPKMPMTATELDKYQRSDFAGVKKHFEAAGVKEVKWECTS